MGDFPLPDFRQEGGLTLGVFLEPCHEKCGEKVDRFEKWPTSKGSNVFRRQ